MKTMNMNRLLTTILTVAALLGNFAYGKTLEEETPVLAQALAKQLVAKQRPKVSAMDFTNIQGMPNELGRFLAEQLAVDMVSAEGITVLDRANISAVMAEHQLTAEGLVKPENAKKLGEFAGVDALLIGNVAAIDKTFTLTVKAISTETAEVVAAGRCKFDVTEDLMKQFSTSISGGGAVPGGGTAVAGSGVTAGFGSPSSQDATGIATKKFENLEIVLMSVTRSSAQVRQNYRYRTTSVPAINCSFEMHNRDLRNTIVIAANGTLEKESGMQPQLEIIGYRGELDDSSGIRWWIPKDLLKGMSAVLCFDYEKIASMLSLLPVEWSLKQNNPADVVSYIRKGTKTGFGVGYQKAINAHGKYWSGAFSPIPPGKSIRVTVGFSPDVGGDNDLDSMKISQSFQFGMELVIGSIMDGAEPETAKDLRLENLTFDKIVMPKAIKENNP
jgi:TolB-like protein